MTKEMFMDILRTILKVMGGMVLAKAAKYGLSVADWNTVSSAVLIFGALGWSWWSTYHLTK